MDKLLSCAEIPREIMDDPPAFAAAVAVLVGQTIEDITRRAAAVSAVIDWTTLKVEVRHDITFNSHAVFATTARTATLAPHPHSAQRPDGRI